MWTNVRGHRVQLFLGIGWILSIVSLLKGQDEDSVWNLFSAHIVLMATSWSLVSGAFTLYLCVAQCVIAIYFQKREHGFSRVPGFGR